jgi:hypothetical protein
MNSKSSNNNSNSNNSNIIGNKSADALWRYKSLLNLHKIYYSSSQHVTRARAYRNLLLRQIKIPNYY